MGLPVPEMSFNAIQMQYPTHHRNGRKKLTSEVLFLHQTSIAFQFPWTVKHSLTSFICSARTSPEMFDHAVCIYARVIHLQPLPLFQIERLRELLPSYPKFLRSTFFALTSSFSDGQVTHGEDCKAVEMHASEARSEVLHLATEGNCSLPVLQALCLLILLDMKCK